MFLRAKSKTQNGKTYTYYQLVEATKLLKVPANAWWSPWAICPPAPGGAIRGIIARIARRW